MRSPKPRTVGALGLTLAAALMLVACPDPIPPECGYVTSCANGAPIEGVRVTKPGKRWLTRSKPNGMYCISADFPDGDYLRFERAGFVTEVVQLGKVDSVRDICMRVAGASDADGGVADTDASDHDGGVADDDAASID